MVRANSIRTREVVYGTLFGPPRMVDRDQASKMHGAVCEAIGHDDLTFRYRKIGPEGQQRTFAGFEIILDRQEGRGGFRAQVVMAGEMQPVQLLMTYTWPPSVQHVTETIDKCQSAIFESLDYPIARVVAEVRIRAQCATKETSGLSFMRRMIGPSADWMKQLGEPISQTSVRIEVAPGKALGDSMANPRRELNIEVLQEDPSQLYLELVSTWPQILDSMGSSAEMPIFEATRPVDREPSEYLVEAHAFLHKRLQGLEQAIR